MLVFDSRQDPAPDAVPGDLTVLEFVDPADLEPDIDWDQALADLADVAALEACDLRVAADVTAWTEVQLSDEAARAERVNRWSAAQGYRTAAELARRRPASSLGPGEQGLSSYAIDEITLTTGISRGAACMRVAEAEALTTRHPALPAALSAGCITVPAVRRVLVATAPLDPKGCGVVERRLLTRCGRPDVRALGDMKPAEMADLSTDVVIAISARASTGWVSRTARILTHRVDPESAARRETGARKNRSVRLEAGDDGMSWLMLHLPQAAAEAGYEHIDTMARALPSSPEDSRDLDAKRADVAAALLTGTRIEIDGAPAGGQAPVQVNIHVLLDQTAPAGATHLTADGATEGVIVGHAGRLGPVTAATVRDLLSLAAATGGTIVTSRATDIPCPGAAAHAAEGPGPYQPSQRLKNLIRARHRTCTFPGCGRNSRHCDLDHRLRWPEGPTCACNLHPLCEHHHQLKHTAPGWIFTHHGDGRVTWTTPSGRRVTVEPERPDDPSP